MSQTVATTPVSIVPKTLYISKRDGRIVAFEAKKISDAIYKAMIAEQEPNSAKAVALAGNVFQILLEKYTDSMPTVENIQDEVERALIGAGLAKVAKQYILYRAERTRTREGRSDLMDTVQGILKDTSRENANVAGGPSAKMLQIASAASRQFYLSRVIPEHLSKPHIRGDYHIHDLDYFGKTINCMQIPLGRLLREGFNAGHGHIRPPKRIGSAAALSCIILQSNQNDMYGGQGFAFFDRDMAPFAALAADENEIFQAMEAVIYNLNSMHSRAGSQVPFSSLNFGCDTSPEGRAVSKGLLLAYEKGLGRGENPIFPNMIFRVKKGINFAPGDPNYDLYRLALRVASKRLNPTFLFMDSTFNAPYGNEAATMDCRTRVIANRRGPEVSDGRGNLSFTTLNLPRLALRAKGNYAAFETLLDRSLGLIGEQLYHRFIVQSMLTPKDIPFTMSQHLYLGSEQLGPNDPIGPALVNGSLSIGFIGLAETLTALTGHHHGQTSEAKQLGLEIVERMRKGADALADRYDLNYSLIATPAEGLSGRFIRMDQKEFGKIPGVTDREFYTNSFHVPVDCKINGFEKISVEAPYHAFCNAGHISYVELPSAPEGNIEAMDQIVRHMAAENMGYAGINYPLDFCESCGYLGVISGKECDHCGSESISRVRRITGYLSTQDRFNDAKRAELKERENNSHLTF